MGFISLTGCIGEFPSGVFIPVSDPMLGSIDDHGELFRRFGKLLPRLVGLKIVIYHALLGALGNHCFIYVPIG